MSPAEEVLSERFNREYARLTANGTTALYLALKYAREVLGAEKVFFPEITCQAAVNSAILNGCAIGVVDVERNHFIVRDSMFETGKCEPSVFVKTDIFGFPTGDADLGQFPSDTFVVEDKAQGLVRVVDVSDVRAVLQQHHVRLEPKQARLVRNGPSFRTPARHLNRSHFSRISIEQVRPSA